MLPQYPQNCAAVRQPAFSTAIAASAAVSSTAASLRRERFIIRVVAAACAIVLLYLTSAQLAEAAETGGAKVAQQAPSNAAQGTKTRSSFRHGQPHAEQYGEACHGGAGHPPAGPFPALPHPAFAQLPSSQHLPPFVPFLRELKLSEAQDDRIFALLHAQVPLVREQERNARKAVDALRELTVSGGFDAAKASELVARHTQAVGALLLQRAETDAAVLAVLTPEQRRQLDTLRQQAPARHASHGHPLPPLAGMTPPALPGQPPAAL